MILYLRQSPGGGGGGADRVIFDTCRLIDRERFPIHLAFLRKRGEDLSLLLSEARNLGIPAGEFPGSRFFDLRQFLALNAFIRERGVRLLHSHDPKTDFVAYLLSLFNPRAKLLATAHGWIAKTRKSQFYVALDKRILRRFDTVIAVSRSNAEIAHAAGVRHVQVVQNGVDTDYWDGRERGIDDRAGAFPPLRVGFVGRLSREKGACEFVRLAHAIVQRGGGCRFVVAGEGPEAGPMRNLADSLGVAARIEFLGFLDRDRLRDLYRDLDVLAVTSTTEGMPMNVLEAASMRVCVAAYRVGGVPEILEDEVNGVMVDWGDLEGLAQRILALAQDRGRMRESGAAARETVAKKFSLKRTVEGIEEVYSALLGL